MNKKRRKTLDDALAEQFVYGGDETQENESRTQVEEPPADKKPEQIKNTSQPKSEVKQSKSDQTKPRTGRKSSDVKQQNQPLRKRSEPAEFGIRKEMPTEQENSDQESQNLSTEKSDSAVLSVETSHRSPKSKIENKELSLMEKLQVQPKEVTKRFTVDLPESMHRKLSILAAKTGRTKADIVRLLLQDALQDVED